MQAQLLDLFDSTHTFDNFIPLHNELVFASLTDKVSQFTHIIGGEYSGKTHLLQAWVSSASPTATPMTSNKGIYLNALHLDKPIEGLETQYTHIAIDNVEHLPAPGQIQLFNLFNQIKLNNLTNQLLTSSSCNLEQAAHLRDDLKTRLLSGLNLPLKAMDDAELLTALTIYVKQEGINIGDTEINYLLTHYTRSIGKLTILIRQAANFAILQNRNITIPLIRDTVTHL